MGIPPAAAVYSSLTKGWLRTRAILICELFDRGKFKIYSEMQGGCVPSEPRLGTGSTAEGSAPLSAFRL